MKLQALVTLSVLAVSLTGCGETGGIVATTGQNLACLSGTWQQSMTDLQNQYNQLMPETIHATVVSGTSTFTFNADHTFSQQLNNVKVQSNIAGNGLDPSIGNNMTMEIGMNGTVTGQYNTDATGALFFENMNAQNLVSSTSMNGQPMMNNQSMGMLPTGTRSTVAATCAGSDMTLNYIIGSKTVALHLSR